MQRLRKEAERAYDEVKILNDLLSLVVKHAHFLVLELESFILFLDFILP